MDLLQSVLGPSAPVEFHDKIEKRVYIDRKNTWEEFNRKQNVLWKSVCVGHSPLRRDLKTVAGPTTTTSTPLALASRDRTESNYTEDKYRHGDGKRRNGINRIGTLQISTKGFERTDSTGSSTVWSSAMLIDDNGSYKKRPPLQLTE